MVRLWPVLWLIGILLNFVTLGLGFKHVGRNVGSRQA
jgi:hypothetical protein